MIRKEQRHMAKRPPIPLDVSELEQIKVLRASGLTYHAISKKLGRDHKTIAKACRAPEMAPQIERVKSDLADGFEDLARRMVVSIKDEDITRINAYQRTVAAAVSTDKMRLLRGASTENLSIRAIVESIEREEKHAPPAIEAGEEREQQARERQEE